MSATLIRELQTRLNQLGSSLTVDGLYGPASHGAAMTNLAELPCGAGPAPPPGPAPGPPDTEVPISWMPPAKMSRVHLHWTAGTHKASAEDKKHYHILVEGDGTLVRGNPSITLNEAPVKPGYAAHTLNANSDAIGLGMCCMRGAVERPFNPGPSPMTRRQWEIAIRSTADLVTRYGIIVTDKTVLTHAEVQANLGIAQRGKWDVAVLAFDPSFNTAKKVGDRLRAEVKEAMK